MALVARTGLQASGVAGPLTETSPLPAPAMAAIGSSASPGSSRSEERRRLSPTPTPPSSSESSGWTSDSSGREDCGDFRRPFSPRHQKSLVSIVNNPFENAQPLTAYEAFKMVSLGLTLFPLRLAVAVALTVCLLAIAALATVGLSLPEDGGCRSHTEPLARWRRAVLAPMSWIVRGVLWSLGFWWIQVVDGRADRSRTPNLLLVAPHQTYLDQFVVAWALAPMISGVGDMGILRMPFGTRLAIATQSILVNVKDHESRQSCKDLVARRAHCTWRGPPLMICPEGRITNGEMLIQFKLGAFQPGEPVLPVLLSYPHRFFNPTCTGKNGGVLWPLRMMTQFVNHCRLEILPVYEPDALSEACDPGLYAQRVRGLMAEKLDLPTTEHTYDDAFLYRAAVQAHVRSDFEMNQMRKLFNVDLPQLKEWLHVFQRLDCDHSGYICRSEFERALHPFFPTFGNERLPTSLDRIFDFFDTDESGKIEYREFVQVLGLLSGKCSAGARAKLAFLVYDVEGRGRVRTDLLRGALDFAFAQPVAPAVPADGASPAVGASRSLECRSLRVPTVLFARHSACESVGEALLPISSQVSAVGAAQPEQLGEELDFDSFCRLAERRPEVLEGALENLRRRMSVTF